MRQKKFAIKVKNGWKKLKKDEKCVVVVVFVVEIYMRFLGFF